MIKNVHTKVYGMVGKALCMGAGATIGCVIGGIGFAALGLLAGFFFAQFLEKSLVSDP